MALGRPSTNCLPKVARPSPRQSSSVGHQNRPLVKPQAFAHHVGRHQKPVPLHASNPHMVDRAIGAPQATIPLRGGDHRAVRANREFQVLSYAIRTGVNGVVTERCRNVHGHRIPFHGPQAFVCGLMSDAFPGRTDNCRPRRKPSRPTAGRNSDCAHALATIIGEAHQPTSNSRGVRCDLMGSAPYQPVLTSQEPRRRRLLPSQEISTARIS